MSAETGVKVDLATDDDLNFDRLDFLQHAIDNTVDWLRDSSRKHSPALREDLTRVLDAATRNLKDRRVPEAQVDGGQVEESSTEAGVCDLRLPAISVSNGWFLKLMTLDLMLWVHEDGRRVRVNDPSRLGPDGVNEFPSGFARPATPPSPVTPGLREAVQPVVKFFADCVEELEQAVSDAESRANERGREIHQQAAEIARLIEEGDRMRDCLGIIARRADQWSQFDMASYAGNTLKALAVSHQPPASGGGGSAKTESEAQCLTPPSSPAAAGGIAKQQ